MNWVPNVAEYVALFNIAWVDSLGDRKGNVAKVSWLSKWDPFVRDLYRFDLYHLIQRHQHHLVSFFNDSRFDLCLDTVPDDVSFCGFVAVVYAYSERFVAAPLGLFEIVQLLYQAGTMIP